MSIVATASKETTDSKVGLTFKEMKGKKIITGISPESIFADSDIKVGLALVSVNGILASMVSPAELVTIMKASESEITVKCEDAGYVSATVSKPDRDCRLGIGVIEREGQIYITSIAKDGLFGDTDLEEGMRIISVNKQPLAGLSSMDAVARFKGAPDQLVVLAEDPGYTVVTVTKESPDAKCGITVKNMDGQIVVTNVNPEGLFAETELKTGMKVVRVNKKETVGLMTVDAMKLFRQAKSEVTVIAEYIGYVGCTVYKESKEAKVGIKLKNKDRDIIVSSIGEGSLFENTCLKEGMKILTVNKNEVTGLSPFQAIEFFKQAEGAVSVFAQEYSDE